MPTIYDAANFVKKIDSETWLILKKILFLSRYYERIPLDKLIRSTKLSDKIVHKRIRILHKNGFIECFKQPYESVRLLTLGLDLIALKKLKDRSLINEIGRQIGTGKESDIFEVITPDGSVLSLKIFRLGRISFRHVRLKREYGPSEIKISWFKRNISAARKEFINLKYVYRKGVSVPRPIFRVLHMILMEKLNGWLLSDIKEFNDPLKVYTMIIYEIKKAYDAGIVNGDLSQFNIFFSSNGDIYLIDWPQAITTGNPKSILYLTSDLINITRYFVKKYNLTRNFILKTLRIYDFVEIIDINEVLKSI